MLFNTSALIDILLTDSPSIDAFKARLEEADTLTFSALSQTESDRLHQMLQLQTPTPPAALFLALLFSRAAQNTSTTIFGELLIATLHKLHALGDNNILIYLVNAIDLVEALSATLSIGLPGLPKLNITNPNLAQLKLNLLELIKTLRVTEMQVQHALDFDRKNTDWTLGFSRFLTKAPFDWKADETALLSLLPNGEGLFTALGFLHGLHYTVKQTVEPEKNYNMYHYPFVKKPISPIIMLNIDITILALKKNLPHPTPFMLAADEKTAMMGEYLIVTSFLNPELTHEHLLTLARALHPYHIKPGCLFNQRLLRAASHAPIVKDTKKPRVLIDHFGWSPDQVDTVETERGATKLGDFITQLMYRDMYRDQSTASVTATLSVLFTLPHITLNPQLIKVFTNNIDSTHTGNHPEDTDAFVYATKHLLSNPSLNAENATELKAEAFNHILAILHRHINAATRLAHKHLPTVRAACALLLRLKNDEDALFRLIQLINAQETLAKAQLFFNDIINHPELTREQRDELSAKTKDRRQKEDPTLLVWPEPITNALLQQPNIRALQAAVQRELSSPGESAEPGFEFSEALPYLPQNQTAGFQYDQLPLALLKDETLEGGMILTNSHTLSLPLSLLLFRNRQFNPTHYAMHSRNGSIAVLSSAIIFSLLGNTQAIFDLPPDDAHCLDSYVDAVIRITINTKLFYQFSTGSIISHIRSAHTTIINSLELAGISFVAHNNQHLINDKNLTESACRTYEKYLTLPAVRSALYQRMVLNEYCLMEGMLSAKKDFRDRLAGTPVTQATLSTLSERLTAANTCDFRSAMLFMAFTDEPIDSPKLSAIIREHLLGKALSKQEKETLINALKLLDETTLDLLKKSIVTWLTSSDDYRKIAQQLIDNHSYETNPLLLTLMMAREQPYSIKETTHYKQLKSALGRHGTHEQDETERELRVMHRLSESEEETTPANDIKEKSRAFIATVFRGEITWSNTAPFLPLPGQAHLPLEQFSLAGISSYELWSHLLKHEKIPYQFLLFLLRHQETPGLPAEEEPNIRRLTFYFTAFTLLGKNSAVFELKADEACHLMSYQEALIKHAIDSRMPPTQTFFAKSQFTRTKATSLDSAIKAQMIGQNTFSRVTYEEVTGCYLDYIKKSPSIAAALRHNELLNYPSLLILPDCPDASQQNTEKFKACLNTHKPTEEILKQLQANILRENAVAFDLRIQSLVLYIAFSSEITSVEEQIQLWLVSSDAIGEKYSNFCKAIEKLSPEHIRHLKIQLNNYCARHRNDNIGNQINAALEPENRYMPLVYLLKFGQNSRKLKLTSNHLDKLTLFYRGKLTNEKDAVKYGLKLNP